MKKNELTPPETWLKERSLDNPIISHPHAGEQYVLSVSDVMREYAECAVNSLYQSGIKVPSNGEKD